VRTLRILLVEDDDDHVFLIRRALADLDDVAVAIEVAGDGEQAVERLARSRFEADGRRLRCEIQQLADHWSRVTA
jgi:CheY-like chemotaxis protein